MNISDQFQSRKSYVEVTHYVGCKEKMAFYNPNLNDVVLFPPKSTKYSYAHSYRVVPSQKLVVS